MSAPSSAFGLVRPTRRLWGYRYVVLYAVLAAGLLTHIRQFHHPETGFSSLITFGEAFQARRLERLRDLPLYTFESNGYDGQFYAQLAVAGNPFDPELGVALDSVSYRARRILLPLLVHLVGGGRPALVLQAYAFANVVCWLLLALLLARWWFPPTSLHNLVRWTGTLFGEGMLSSIRHSLTDTPALLLIALGVRMVETNRQLIGGALLGAAGLVRETSVLCAAALLPTTKEAPGNWLRAVLAAALCVVPIVVWAGFLSARYGGTGSQGNFSLPLVSYVGKLLEIDDSWRAHGFLAPTRVRLWTVIALGTQAGFVLARPQLEQMWWRIGGMFALLWLCLGGAVWEGIPSAASRAVLPLTLAFNALVPRTRRGYVILLAGNLTVLSAPNVLVPPPMPEETVFVGAVSCSYATGWHAREQLGGRTWRWASGSSATLHLHNPTPATPLISLAFDMVSVMDRIVTMHVPDLEQSYTLGGATKRLFVTFGPFRLSPGDTSVIVRTAEPPWVESFGDGRSLTFSLEDLRIQIPRRFAPVFCESDTIRKRSMAEGPEHDARTLREHEP